LKSANHLTISAFARMCGVNSKTQRFYDDIGLFRPVFVDAYRGRLLEIQYPPAAA
jgi:DNA-binding transcriptional MerR regulator